MDPFFVVVFLFIALLVGIVVVSKINADQRRSKIIAEFYAFIENLKTTKTLAPISTHIILKPGEVVYLECKSTLSEARSVRYYQSNRVGVRVVKGLYVGKSSGMSHSRDELQSIDSGTLTLTNLRLIFNGKMHDKVVPLEKLMAINTSYIDAIEISSDNRQKSMTVSVPNPMIWAITIKLVKGVPDPQDLSNVDFPIIVNDSQMTCEIRVQTVEPTYKPLTKLATKPEITAPIKLPNQTNILEPQSSSSVSVRSNISRNFRNSIENLRKLFPAASSFLNYIEVHSDDGFWLSTAINAHLYFKDSFLAYIRITAESILFSPYFNGHISGATVDRHELIFPYVFIQLTKNTDGKMVPWARIDSDGAVTLTKNAPKEFFDNLVVEIKRAHKLK